MNRHRFLETMAAASLAIAFSDCNPEMPFELPDVVTAGKLYFSNHHPHLERSALEEVADNIIGVYSAKGIYFEEKRVLDKGERIPELNGLDIILYFTENLPASTKAPRYGSYFGLQHNSKSEDHKEGALEREFEALVDMVGFPYDIEAARNHVAVVAPPYLGGPFEAITSDERVFKQNLKFLSIHDIDHGLGAPHLSLIEGCPKDITPRIWIPPDFPTGYFMGRGVTRNVEMHEETVKRIKEFVTKVRSRDYTPDQIIDLREDYVLDCPLVQES